MRLLLAAVAMAVIATPTCAAPPKPACAGPAFKQLDFWLGDWDAAWKGGHGSNHITKTYEGCVIEEHFDGAPGMHLKGHSVSAYSARMKRWHQTWVDNEGGYIPLTGGPDGKGRFILVTNVHSPTDRHTRMVFEDIKPDSFTWRWQVKKGKTWADNWVIRYTRKKP